VQQKYAPWRQRQLCDRQLLQPKVDLPSASLKHNQLLCAAGSSRLLLRSAETCRTVHVAVAIAAVVITVSTVTKSCAAGL
jgi:hypothetical protein